MEDFFEQLYDEIVTEMQVKELRTASKSLYSAFESLVDAGFTREEAMFITIKALEMCIGGKK